MDSEFVQLERTFRELSLEGGDKSGDEFDAHRLWYGKSVGWPSLLAEYRVVILSEAGSGKTAEIHHAAHTLRTEGKPAFFLRLEHVADDLEIAFEEGSLSELKQWIASDVEGWVFLDSVDEARLREPLDFERAIRKIGSVLSRALQRAHIVLTSRGSAWRPVTDLKLCQQHLPFRAQKPSDQLPDQDSGVGEANGAAKNNTFKIVALADLNSDQAATFASASGLTVTDESLFGIPFESVVCESGACATVFPSSLARRTGSGSKRWSRLATPLKSMSGARASYC